MRNLLMVVLAILMVSFVRDHGKKAEDKVQPQQSININIPQQ